MKKLTFAISLLVGINFFVNAQPTAITSDPIKVYFTAADLEGDCTGDNIDTVGICYSSTNTSPVRGDVDCLFEELVNQPAGIFDITILGLTPNTTYYYRSYAIDLVDGIAYGEIMQFTTASQISNLSVTAITTNSMTLQWTNGTGDHRLLIGKKATSTTILPNDGTSYTASSTFGSGNNLGSSTYALYSNTGNSVVISNLTTGGANIFKAYEFITGGDPNPDYLTDENSNNVLIKYTLPSEPTVQASTIVFNSTSANQINLSWTVGTGGGYRLVLVHQSGAVDADPVDGTWYTANTTFGSGAQIGNGNYVVYNSTSNTVTVDGLTANTTYYFKVYEFKLAGTAGTTSCSPNYLLSGFSDGNNPNSKKTIKDEPSQSSLSFSNIASSSIDVTITRGNGDGVLVLATQGATISDNPADHTTYSSANASYGTTGTELGSSYIVYNNNSGGSSFILSGLSPGTTYTLKAFEYSNSGTDIDYNISDITNNPRTQTTVYNTPSEQAYELSFSGITTSAITLTWSGGNGANSLVIAGTGDLSSSTPTDGSTYNADNNWGDGNNGSTIGNGTVIYNGSDASVALSGLSAGTTYNFRVFEYNGSGTSSVFNTSTATNNPNSQATLKGEPGTQAYNLSFSNVTDISMTVGLTRGNGDGVIILAHENGAVDDFPVDGTDTYSANSAFGGGTQLGTGNYVVYKGTDSPVSFSLTNLSAQKTYYLRASEYNNSGSNINYNNSSATNNPRSQATLVSEPTVQASNIVISSITANGLSLSWTASGDATNYLVLGHQGASVDADPADNSTYTANTTFESGSQVGTLNYVIYNGTSTSTTVSGLSANTAYYFKVYAFNGPTTPNYLITGFPSGTNPNNATTLKSEPTVQANSINFTNVATTSLTVNWTRGDAVNNDGCIVVAKAGGSINNTPADGTDYTENSVFTSAQELVGGSGERVVYQGTGTTANITGLTAGTTYYFRVYEYNNSGTSIDYLTSSASDNPNTTTTGYSAPSTQATNITFSNIQAGQVSLYWTNGDGARRIVVARAGTISDVPTDGMIINASYTFAGGGTDIGNNTYIVYDGTGTVGSSNPITVTGLAAGTTYYFQVFEYNGTGTSSVFLNTTNTNNPNSFTTLFGQPTVQSSLLTFTNITATSMRVNFTRGNGEGVLVACKLGSTIAGTPTDGTVYTASSVFGEGSLIGTSARVIFTGNQNYCDVTGLTAGTTYYFRVYEYNNSGANINYFTDEATDNPSFQATLAGEPTTQASGIVFSDITDNQATLTWTSGNGQSRVVVARLSATSASEPVDGTEYTANTVFGSSGSQIGSSSNYVVYSGTSNTVTVTGLSSSTAYTFKVYEFNNSGTNTNYLVSDGSTLNPNATTTLAGEPSVQAHSFTFTNVGMNTIDVSFTRGDVANTGVLVIARAGSAIADMPSDGTDYAASNVYGSNAVGSGFAVYKGTGSSFTISNLSAGTQYYFQAFEYNNAGSDINYLTSTATDNPASQFSFSSEPSTQASDIVFDEVTSNSVTLSWTNGNGLGRLVVVRQGGTVNPLPTDKNNYTANSVFGQGSIVGVNGYAVYSGTGSSVTVTGLTSSTNYYFQVFEYNNDGLINYNTTNGTNNPRPQTTSLGSTPTVQASNITFSNYTSTSFTISWTNGDGASRLVAMRANDQGTITNPSDGSTYQGDSYFSGGDQLGTSGYYVVYAGSENIVEVSNLVTNTTYWVQIFEYNNSGIDTRYLTTTNATNPLNGKTLSDAPIAQDYSAAVSNIRTNAMTFSWINGDGEHRVVFLNTTGSFGNPVDNTTYVVGTTYSGLGTCIYNGNGSTVEATGLSASTTYYFKVLGFNNPAGYELYCTSGSDNTDSGTTLGAITWNGNTSEDWDTGSNWSGTFEPNSNYTVIIPSSATNMPVISSGSNGVDMLTVEAGATLTIANGGSLTVNGDALFESLSGSEASGALVIPGTGSFTVNGTTTIERYNDSDNWRFFAYPVTNPNITVFNGYFVNAYDESSSSWSHLNSVSSVSVMQGLSVKYSTNTNPSRNITFTGTLNNGNQNISVTNTSGTGNGWNLIGNPYPSAIDWPSVGLSGGAEGSAYLYNGTSYGYVNEVGTTSGGVTRYIPAMQGFFVHATAGGTVSLSNAARVSNSQSFYKKADNAYPLLRIATKNDYYSSDAVVVFYNDAQNGFDSKYDAYFKYGSNDSVPEIYTINSDGIQYAINGLNTDIIQSMTEPLVVNLGIKANLEEPVTISISEKSNLQGIEYIYLYDNLFETYFNLTNDDKTLVIGQETNDRFKLVVSKNPLDVNEHNSQNKIDIFTYQNEVFVKSDYLETNNGTIYVFDMMGRMILSQPAMRAALQKVNLNEKGSYIVKVISNQISTNQIVIVN